jgi:hypothetical protein
VLREVVENGRTTTPRLERTDFLANWTEVIRPKVNHIGVAAECDGNPGIQGAFREICNDGHTKLKTVQVELNEASHEER